MHKPIFIVGPHRSGSTLWHNIITNNKRILRVSEPRFLGRKKDKDVRYFFQENRIKNKNLQTVKTFVDSTLSTKNSKGLGTHFWKFEDLKPDSKEKYRRALVEKIRNSDLSFNKITTIYLEEYVKTKKSERCCVKFPVDISYVPELINWYSDCKILHIIRDPRGLAMSKTNDPSGSARKLKRIGVGQSLIKKLAIVATAFDYRRHSIYYNQYKRLKNYRLFHYEDLLFDPENTINKLCEFIEIEFSENLISFDGGNQFFQKSSITGKEVREIDPGVALRGIKLMTPTEKWLMKILAGKSVSRFAYAFDNHPIFNNEDV